MVKTRRFIHPVVIALLVLSLAMVGVPLGTGKVFAASTYYVNAGTGNDGNDGSAAHPWKTISHAVDQASDGDTITVAPGTYDHALGEDDHITIDKALSVRSSGGAGVTIIRGDTAIVDVMMDTGHAVTVSGFTLTTTDEGTGIYVYGNLEDISLTITENIIKDCSYQGIDIGSYVFGDSNIFISRNFIQRNGYEGIHFGGTIEDSTSVTISRNAIEGNGDQGIQFGSDVEDNSDIVIRDNVIQHNGDEGIEFDDYVEEGSHVAIQGNTIHDNGDEGILFDGDIENDSAISITGNDINENHDQGIEFLSEIEDDSHVIIQSNTIRGNNDEGIKFTNVIGYYEGDQVVVIVDGNGIADNWDDGIYFEGDWFYEVAVQYGSRVTVSSNEITGSGYHGLFFEYDIIDNSQVTVSGNKITDSGDQGIEIRSYFYDDSVITLTKNRVDNSGDDGIEFCEDFNDRTSCTVSGNTIINSNGHGLEFEEEIEEDSVVTVTGNNINNNCGDGLYLDDVEDNSRVTVSRNTINSNGGTCEEEGRATAPAVEDDDEDTEPVHELDEEDTAKGLPRERTEADDEADDEAEMGINIDTSESGNGVDINAMDEDNQVTVSACNFLFDNEGFGLLNTSEKMVDGRLNWWGNESGPSGEGPGSGDEVSTDVDFAPWAVPGDCGIPVVEEEQPPPPPPPPPQRPRAPGPSPYLLNQQAVLSLQYLNVTPQQIAANQPVTISANVVNTGTEGGNYAVALKINDRIEETRTVSVSAKGTQPVRFTVARAQPGTYAIDINGQRGSFTVLGGDNAVGKSPVSSSPIAIVLFSVLGMAVVALVAVIARRRAT